MNSERPGGVFRTHGSSFVPEPLPLNDFAIFVPSPTTGGSASSAPGPTPTGRKGHSHRDPGGPGRTASVAVEHQPLLARPVSAPLAGRWPASAEAMSVRSLVPPDPIAVLGAGNMGSGIAQAAAQAGFRVRLRDLNEEMLARG